MFSTATEPAIVCSSECAAEVRQDDQRQTWLEQPVSKLVLDLALQYGPPRRSWRCTICRSSQRADIDQALLDGASQRQVAEQYGFAKGSVANHAIAHLPVSAVIAAGRG